MFTRAQLILNPAAAGGRNRGGQVRSLQRLLLARGIRTQVVQTTAPGHARALAAGVGTGPGCLDLLIAGGGDGTIGEIADGLRRSAAPLTPVLVAPLGTGNDVARLLGTACDGGLAGALDVPRPVDWDTLEIVSGAGRGRGLLFGACGFSTDLLRLTTPRVKRWCGARLA
ncbi:MAG: diacylglycerol/lipid kinase family protein, partial [Verrucomicrobiota bacterium]